MPGWLHTLLNNSVTMLWKKEKFRRKMEKKKSGKRPGQLTWKQTHPSCVRISEAAETKVLVDQVYQLPSRLFHQTQSGRGEFLVSVSERITHCDVFNMLRSKDKIMEIVSAVGGKTTNIGCTSRGKQKMSMAVLY